MIFKYWNLKYFCKACSDKH